MARLLPHCSDGSRVWNARTENLDGYLGFNFLDDINFRNIKFRNVYVT